MNVYQYTAILLTGLVIALIGIIVGGIDFFYTDLWRSGVGCENIIMPVYLT